MNDSTRTSRRRSGAPKPLIALVLVAAVGAILYGVHKYRTSGAGASEYLVGTVQISDIEDLVTATGTLQPRDYVDVGAQVSGQIEKIFVEVGDVVKTGDILIEIDATTSAARVESNRHSLASSQTSLKDAHNTLEKARRDHQRQLNLFAEDATTEEQVQNAATSLESAINRIAQLESDIKRQEANMRIEETNLRFTTIRAPFDGTVMSIAVRQGQTVNATQTAPVLLRVADLSTMTVQAEVSEADISKLTLGMNAYFTTLSGQERRWYGTLKRIEPTPRVQQGVVLYNALFDVSNEGEDLKPSMTAQVYFVRVEERNVLTVPMAALQQGQQLARQFAQQQQGQATAAPEAGAPAAAAEEGLAAGSAPAMAAAGEGGMRGPRGQGGPGGMGNFPGMDGPPSPEQMEQFQRMREQRGGGGMRGMGMMGMGNNQRPGEVQQRRGVVFVRKADDALERRDVVIGVTNRVYGQVLSGLSEGDEVIIGRSEQNEAAAATPQNQQGRPGNMPGNFQGGGGNFGGGGFRPF